MASVFGLSLACFAGVCNGSFGLISKLPVVRNAQASVPPYAQAHWMAQGAGLASLLLALLPSCRVLSWWGMLSGLLFATSLQTVFPAIAMLGLGPACAVWSGTAVLASLAWGMAGAGDKLQRPLLAVPAVACLVAGVTGASLARLLDEPPHVDGEEEEDGRGVAQRAASTVEKGPASASPALFRPSQQERMDSGVMERERLLPGIPEREAGLSAPASPVAVQGASYSPSTSRRQRNVRAWARALARQPALRGTLAAVATGLAGGLVLAPMSAAPPEAQGLAFMPSLALGTMLASPVYALPRGAREAGFEQLGRSAAVVPGLAMGAIWATGNAAAAAAAALPEVGLVLAYPIMQGVGVAVAEAWGVLLLGELRHGLQRLALVASCCLVIAGIALLVRAKGDGV